MSMCVTLANSFYHFETWCAILNFSWNSKTSIFANNEVIYMVKCPHSTTTFLLTVFYQHLMKNVSKLVCIRPAWPLSVPSCQWSSLLSGSFRILFSVMTSKLLKAWFLRATAGTAVAHLSFRISVCSSLFVCLSHGWTSQKRCKLGSPNLHHWLPGRL